jgi:spectinomycin phosphotransferase
MKESLFQRIRESYALDITSYAPAPRQFVAETFILSNQQGDSYFCKIVDKPVFIAQIIASLPALDAIHALGFERIGYPIRTRSGALHVLAEQTLIVLFNYIDAPQNYTYDEYAFGTLTGQIHRLTPQVRVDMPRESFGEGAQEYFERVLGARSTHSDDAVTQALHGLLAQHKAALRAYYAIFLEVAATCRADPGTFVITHGDAPGNVLVKSADDLYIIDWDDISLAPAERDLWFLDARPAFMAGYRSVYPGYQIDARARTFAILSYYFNSLTHYFNEILPAHADEYRRSHLATLAEYLDPARSWIAPYLLTLPKQQ